jgi:hypothetical protein
MITLLLFLSPLIIKSENLSFKKGKGYILKKFITLHYPYPFPFLCIFRGLLAKLNNFFIQLKPTAS